MTGTPSARGPAARLRRLLSSVPLPELGFQRALRIQMSRVLLALIIFSTLLSVFVSLFLVADAVSRYVRSLGPGSWRDLLILLSALLVIGVYLFLFVVRRRPRVKDMFSKAKHRGW